MAVPQKRQSSTRRDKRRANDAIKATGFVTCPQCGETMRPHRVCPDCGSLRGREVIAPKDEFEE